MSPGSRSRKARPVVFAMYVAQAAISDADGSIDVAIVLMRNLQYAASESGEVTKVDLCIRAIDLLRFAKNPRRRSPQSASISLERFAAEIDDRKAVRRLPA